jgi:hypothetical protein
VPKSRIICIGLLAMALVAFVVDRLFFPSEAMKPASAVASSAQSEKVSGTLRLKVPDTFSDSGPAASPDPPPAPRLPVISERLKALATGGNLDPACLREAFAPSDEWLAVLSAPKVAAPLPQADLAADFTRKHKLTSVLMAGSAGCAVVDGKIVRIGQELDGFRLESLAPDCAVFQAVQGPVSVTLSLSIPVANP